MRLKILKFIRNHGVSWYNTPRRGLITLTYLKGRLILCHETWSEKFANFIFRSKADPFWRSIPASKVLPKSPCPTALVSVYPFSSAQQQIYDSRRDVGIDLSNFARVRTNRDFSSPKAEWSLPISYRTPYLSQSYDLAAIPPSDGPPCSSKTADTSRPITSCHDDEAISSSQDHLRSGFYGSSPVWQTRNGSSRVQSKKMGQTFIPSSCLFQWNHEKGNTIYVVKSIKGKQAGIGVQKE